MQVEIIEPAQIELDACPPIIIIFIYWRDAIAYYEIQLPGLGKEYLNHVSETIKLVERFPQHT